MLERPQVDPEIVAEQQYLDTVYERLDAMRLAASTVADAYGDVRRGGTHQARLERDIAVDHTQRRLAALEIGDTPLCFGRIDLDEGGRFYVGRLGVEDDEHTQLVVDWRAPVAEPFYRATALERMGVMRRRHLLTRNGREVIGLDDEVFDANAAASSGLAVMGEGALMAALERERTGRMGDIVATIQAEQDAAVRAELPGVLIVSGGPGTGKTAVALHRAAYLLYTFRKQLGAQGVLLIGPSTIFLRYIEQVLPSLGEHEVQLATVAGLKSSLRATICTDPAEARLKGDVRMVSVLKRALRDREHIPRRNVEVLIDGLILRLTRQECRQVIDRARRRPGNHNGRRPLVERMVVDRLLSKYRDAKARKEDFPPEFEEDLRRRLRRSHEVIILLERMWPVLSGADLVHDLCSFKVLIGSAGRELLTDAEQHLLFRARAKNTKLVAWNDADCALVDEADALCGAVESARPIRNTKDNGHGDGETASNVMRDLGLGGYMTSAALEARFADPNTRATRAIPELRTFGHVLVDEAQDLSPMQWRMLARRCPHGSMTIVGDFGQASKAGASSGWTEVLGHLPRLDAPRRATLTVNYRTPVEIMDVANRILAVAASDVEPTQSVRRTGIEPLFALVADPVEAAIQCVRETLLLGGTVAVIAPDEAHSTLTEALQDVGAVADSPTVLDAAVGVIGPVAAKGLEFDHVIVVEPAQLVTQDSAGLRLLYVTLTRATQTLSVFHSRPLPGPLATPA